MTEVYNINDHKVLLPSMPSIHNSQVFTQFLLEKLSRTNFHHHLAEGGNWVISVSNLQQRYISKLSNPLCLPDGLDDEEGMINLREVI